MKVFVGLLALVALVSADHVYDDIDWTSVRPAHERLQLPENIQKLAQQSKPLGRIVGGTEATPNSIPSMVALLLTAAEGTFFCGGSLISPSFVLTAAHCLDGIIQAQVVLGAHRWNELEDSQVRRFTNSFTQHQAWNPATLVNDIALINLGEPVPLSFAIQLIALPRHQDVTNSFNGASARLSGWGMDSDAATSISPVLRQVFTNVMSNLLCNVQFLGQIQGTHICTSGSGGVGACGGDSGSPVVTGNMQAADRDFDVNFATISTRHISLRPPPELDQPTFERIVGGREARRNSIPYQAGVIIRTDRGNFFCGGTLISTLYVLTAAHCLDWAETVHVRLGAHTIEDNEPTQVRINASRWVQHQQWNRDLLTNDIGVIELSREVITNDNIQTVNLPRRSQIFDSFNGRRARISGWGLDSDFSDSVSRVLREVDVGVIGNFLCNIYYFGGIRRTNICTSGAGTRGSCSGDSGGPLMIDNIQVGIVSFGIGLGCELRWPSAFTRVTSYLDWIEMNTNVNIRP
ncbi:chymotrypsin-related [Holotrichia oblita]|uniref:Chymotrypsin-related n=1 Tax=Holotrichia oblita TaxID=644536 RepID=A0ACB9TQC8_HOLOL|nr:chymotrypsin-related [Holotrichia oblita]